MNPFKFGKQYEPSCFIDREDEYNQLLKAVLSGNNVILVAPRRFGKTWLLQKFVYESGFKCIYVDFFGLLSLKDLAIRVISQSFELLKLNDPFEFIKQYVRNLSRHISFSVQVKGISFNLDKGVDDEVLLNGCYELLARISEVFGTVVVCLDEFQMYKMISEKLAGSLRSFFQTASKVVFVFSGSVRHMVEEMFFQSKGILYHSGIRVDLGSFLPKEAIVNYLVCKFKDSGKFISKEIAEEFYQITKGHPYYVQILAYEIWNLCKQVVSYEDLQNALNQLISRESLSYDMAFDILGQKYLRKVLLMIASSKDIFSLETLREYEIPNPSVVNKTVKKLVELGFVEKLSPGNYQITDPIFEEYVLRRFS